MSRNHDLALILLRVPIGLYFALAGYNKIAGPGVVGFVSSNIENASRFMPPAVGKAYLFSLPFVELLVGLMLIVGMFTRVSAVLVFLMLVSFIIAATGVSANIAGVVGSGGPPFHANVVFLFLALAILILGPGRWAMDQLLRNRPAGHGP